MAENENLDLKLHLQAPAHGEALAALVESSLPAEANLRLEVTLIPPRSKDPFLRVGLRVGDRKWFVVKDLPDFLHAWQENKSLPFQSRFVFEPSWMRFRDEDQRILSLLARMVSLQELGRWVPSPGDARLMRLPGAFAEDLLSLLQTQPFRVMREEGSILSLSAMAESAVPLRIECRMTPRGLSLAAPLPPDLHPLVESCRFLLSGEHVLVVPEEQRDLLNFLLSRREEN